MSDRSRNSFGGSLLRSLIARFTSSTTEPSEGEKVVGIVGRASESDRQLYPQHLSKGPKVVPNGAIFPYLSTFANHPDCKVLEIGSRAVVSDSLWRKFIPECDYVGFDFHSGKNVDVVGDAHRISKHFADVKFDVVISLAVFEHLAFPWLVAEEIAKILKVGGQVVIETHFSFSEHEQPWHFFQFNSNALEWLFNEKLGFRVIDAGMYSPMVGRFSFDHRNRARAGEPVRNLYCHSCVVAEKTHEPELANGAFDWRSLLDDLTAENQYPDGTGLSKK
jgi:SAM-dependent methyltransferase